MQYYVHKGGIFICLLLFCISIMGCKKKEPLSGSSTVLTPTWHEVDSPTNKSLHSVWFVDENNGWAVAPK
ncbi:MAG: hypothetical protein QMD71_08375 [bacterium]|nr:hypothetical protein [bacterium]